jgi:hypothetical protein
MDRKERSLNILMKPGATWTGKRGHIEHCFETRGNIDRTVRSYITLVVMPEAIYGHRTESEIILW